MTLDRGLWGIGHAVEGFFFPGDFTRDYDRLLPWWWLREGIVQDFRRWEAEGVGRHVFIPSVHHDELVAAAHDRKTITVFVDLQPKNPLVDQGIMKDVQYIGEGSTKVGTVVYAGSSSHRFNLWIDDANSYRGPTDQDPHRAQVLPHGTQLRLRPRQGVHPQGGYPADPDRIRRPDPRRAE